MRHGADSIYTRVRDSRAAMHTKLQINDLKMNRKRRYEAVRVTKIEFCTQISLISVHPDITVTDDSALRYPTPLSRSGVWRSSGSDFWRPTPKQHKAAGLLLFLWLNSDGSLCTTRGSGCCPVDSYRSIDMGNFTSSPKNWILHKSARSEISGKKLFPLFLDKSAPVAFSLHNRGILTLTHQNIVILGNAFSAIAGFQNSKKHK